MLCLVVLTANATPVPQGLVERVIEGALERGVQRAAEQILDGDGVLGGSRGFREGGYGRNGNFDNFNNNYPIGGGIGPGSIYPGQNYYG